MNIDAANCAVVVRGWDKREVKYSVSRVNSGRSVPIPVFIKTQKGKPLKITVETEPRGAKFGKDSQIRLEVFVPKKSNLEIHTHRELRLEGVSGDINLKSEDGAVNLRDVGVKT